MINISSFCFFILSSLFFVSSSALYSFGKYPSAVSVTGGTTGSTITKFARRVNSILPAYHYYNSVTAVATSASRCSRTTATAAATNTTLTADTSRLTICTSAATTTRHNKWPK
jgi:hypothetical protein